MSEDIDFSRGTFKCDVCGLDHPHHHTDEEIVTERFVRPAFEKTTVPRGWFHREFRGGPYGDRETESLWQHFLSGWFAAKRGPEANLIADLQSQLAEERASQLTALRIIVEDKPGAALNAVQEDYKDLVELVGQERAKRGELIERLPKVLGEHRYYNLGKSWGCTCGLPFDRTLDWEKHIVGLISDPSASQAFDATKNPGPALGKTPAESGRPVDLSSTADRGVLARFDAMQQREQKLREALSGMLRSIDCPWENNDMGHDFAQACFAARAALAES